MNSSKENEKGGNEMKVYVGVWYCLSVGLVEGNLVEMRERRKKVVLGVLITAQTTQKDGSVIIFLEY